MVQIKTDLSLIKHKKYSRDTHNDFRRGTEMKLVAYNCTVYVLQVKEYIWIS